MIPWLCGFGVGLVLGFGRGRKRGQQDFSEAFDAAVASGKVLMFVREDEVPPEVRFQDEEGEAMTVH
jgi:hypothetical protein